MLARILMSVHNLSLLLSICSHVEDMDSSFYFNGKTHSKIQVYWIETVFLPNNGPSFEGYRLVCIFNKNLSGILYPVSYLHRILHTTECRLATSCFSLHADGPNEFGCCYPNCFCSGQQECINCNSPNLNSQ